MMNYDKASYFDINKAVAEALGLNTDYSQDYSKEFKKNHPNSVWFMQKDRLHFEHKDWCNNWSDAGPIIMENKINLEYNSEVIDEWSALGGYFNGLKYDIECSHINPLRAVMIVFLKLKDVEKWPQ